MIVRSDVTFVELRQILVDLGFTVSKRGKFWYFEHSSSKTDFVFRPYRVREKITHRDLQNTRLHLDLRGLLEEREFDDLLKKATA